MLPGVFGRIPGLGKQNALVTLRLFPLSQDVRAHAPEELVCLWREHGGQRAVGLARVRQLRASAERSIGLTQGLHAQSNLFLKYDIPYEFVFIAFGVAGGSIIIFRDGYYGFSL